MANGKRAYILTDTVAPGANATLESDHRVGANERFTATHILIERTSTFQIRKITNDSGLPYTNADEGDPITEQAFPDALTEHGQWLALPAPIVVEKADSIHFGVTDTSGATNTVRIHLMGSMEQLEK